MIKKKRKEINDLDQESDQDKRSLSWSRVCFLFFAIINSQPSTLTPIFKELPDGYSPLMASSLERKLLKLCNIA